ncbi:hypothetical protein [Robiginitalea biformata]|uniref:Lipoprotein n=1 Tax=Robiginitalea biformata (strain ATCC BAA-864 / DSM 15991 / KCTC 12146 / HTCC2501) TaxID=313596 RepID=A4CI79_ROBBH|nr:hypothetical protein [Robiginitalea biformata]EAR16637.1 hypothetical protein RB2501_07045 [Robiginitalea biformata HTCC2501]
MKTNSSFFKNSIFGVSLFACILIAAGCTHDSVGVSSSDDAESLNMVSARGKKARPIKATLFNFEDPNEQDVLICSPQEFGFPLTRNIIGGRMSHLGKLQQGVSHAVTGDMLSGSFGVPVTCDINVVTFRELVTTFEVTYVAANGDQFVTIEHVSIQFPNTTEGGGIDYTTGTFTNALDGDGNPIPITIKEGTGRFQNATGEFFQRNARFGPEGTFWELEGEITY